MLQLSYPISSLRWEGSQGKLPQRVHKEAQECVQADSESNFQHSELEEGERHKQQHHNTPTTSPYTLWQPNYLGAWKCSFLLLKVKPNCGLPVPRAATVWNLGTHYLWLQCPDQGVSFPRPRAHSAGLHFHHSYTVSRSRAGLNPINFNNSLNYIIIEIWFLTR